MGYWTWASATTKGTSHNRTGARRQDAFRCYVPAATPEYLICVVSDGAGSADYGGEGATLVCRTFSLAVQDHLRIRRELPTDEEVRSWIDRVRDRISYAASLRGKTPRDFAATMISVISDGRRSLITQIGDGCVVLKNARATEWRMPLWPDHGEYASTTTFVTDDPETRCRIVRDDAELVAVAALTDGLERLALDFSSLRPFGGFFEGMAKPVSASTAVGKDALLSAMLKQYLDGEDVCARTDDDKTLVIAVRR